MSKVFVTMGLCLMLCCAQTVRGMARGSENGGEAITFTKQQVARYVLTRVAVVVGAVVVTAVALGGLENSLRKRAALRAR